jgi:hypothetical protein
MAVHEALTRSWPGSDGARALHAGLHTGEREVRADDIGGIAVYIGARERTGRAERGAGVQHAARPRDRVRTRIRMTAALTSAQRRAGRVVSLRRHLYAGCETWHSKARKPANAKPLLRLHGVTAVSGDQGVPYGGSARHYSGMRAGCHRRSGAALFAADVG